MLMILCIFVAAALTGIAVYRLGLIPVQSDYARSHPVQEPSYWIAALVAFSVAFMVNALIMLRQGSNITFYNWWIIVVVDLLIMGVLALTADNANHRFSVATKTAIVLLVVVLLGGLIL